MRHVWTGDRAPSYLIVLEPGEEVMASIARFASENEIGGARLWGIGAFEHTRLGSLNRETKRYDEHVIDEQVELLGLHGNVSRYEGRPRVHAHVIVGMADGSARGGHLLEARVWPTLELFVTAGDVAFEREMNEDAGIPLLRP